MPVNPAIFFADVHADDDDVDDDVSFPEITLDESAAFLPTMSGSASSISGVVSANRDIGTRARRAKVANLTKKRCSFGHGSVVRKRRGRCCRLF